MPAKSSSPTETGGLGADEPCERFSYVLDTESVPEAGLEISLSASEAERAALASQCGLAGVQDFQASYQIRKRGLGGLKVTGLLKACVVQICVVTLEPFEAQVLASIDVDFAPQCAPQELKAPGSEVIAVLGADPPDPIINGKIDLGALAAEFLLLNLDIYPRKPGAVFEIAQTGAGTERDAKTQDSPFAVLRDRR